MKNAITLLSALLLASPATLHGADVGDQPESVSPSDLVYERPAETPDAGQPIGNGRMGTMVWTSPAAVHLQINRVDVFAVKELLANLAPYPLGNDPRAKTLTGGALADDVWAAGYLGEIDGQHNPEDVWLTPVFPFEDWTLETRDAAADPIVQKLLDLAPRHASVLRGAGLNTAIRTPIAVARAGHGKQLPQVLERYYAAFAPLPNGMSLFEGPTAASVEHLGLLTMTLQESLLQSVSPRPGEPEVICVFPAWPTEWDASFCLLARGGFLVSSEIQAGKVQFVEIESRLGEECRLRNPWAGMCVIAERNGGGQKLVGELLRFRTMAGSRYRCIPEE